MRRANKPSLPGAAILALAAGLMVALADPAPPLEHGVARAAQEAEQATAAAYALAMREAAAAYRLS